MRHAARPPVRSCDDRIRDAGAREIEAQRAEAVVYGPAHLGIEPPSIEPPPIYGAAVLRIMDLPMLRETDVPWAPYAAASASPWSGIVVLDSATGSGFSPDVALSLRATMGETLAPFNAGPTACWDRANVLSVKIYAGELASRSEDDILAGAANALAIQSPDGDWEIVQFANATLVAPNTYRLTMLLRGRLGTEHAIRSPLPAGASVVLLDRAIAQLETTLAERGQARFYRWGRPASMCPTAPGSRRPSRPARSA